MRSGGEKGDMLSRREPNTEMSEEVREVFRG